MKNAGGGKKAHHAETDIFGHPLPELDHRADPRVLRQVGVEFGLVGVLEHIHDVCPAHAGRIVKAGVLEAARLQVLDPTGGVLLHLLLGAEHDRVGRTGLGAGRPLPDSNPIRAQRALVGSLINFRDTRDVERASLDAITAADAFLVVEVDDAVRVLNDRAGRRAGLQTAWIGAMHASVLADEPFQILALRIDPFGEPHDGERLGREVDRIVVDAVVEADFFCSIVPLHAGDLASLAADAFRHIDQLRHRRQLPCGRRHGRGRTANEVGLSQVDFDVLGRCGRKDEFECHRFLPSAQKSVRELSPRVSASKEAKSP